MRLGAVGRGPALASLLMLAVALAGTASALPAAPADTPDPASLAPDLDAVRDLTPRHAPERLADALASAARDLADALPDALPEELRDAAEAVLARVPGPTPMTSGDEHEAMAAAAPHADGLGWQWDGPPAPTGANGLASTAAGVSAVALLAGALAYYWPTMKYGFAALYTRIPRDAVLAHETRERIYKLVRDQPGIHVYEVCDRLGLGWGTAVHHLKILQDQGMLTSHRDGRYRRFFLVGDDRISYREAVGVLRHPTSRRIAQVVASRPGLIQKDVCAALGLSTSLVAWHLGRLKAAGVVSAERRGRTIEYRPGPAWEHVGEPGDA
jgi:predicted transcriptional regulator